MAGLAQIPIPYPEADAKNLFVRDDKKRDYYLITVKGDKRVDLKEFRRNNQTRALSFATAQELMSILGLPPGSVTPLGLLHDPTGKVHFYIGRRFFGAPGPDRRTSQRQHGHRLAQGCRPGGHHKRTGEPGACGSPINLAGTLSPREYRRGKGASASIWAGAAPEGNRPAKAPSAGSPLPSGSGASLAQAIPVQGQ